VTHLSPERSTRIRNPVDGHDVPVPHFGLILSVPAFQKLAGRLQDAGALEFKAFADDSQVFAV
jgi:hypothetical protein